MGGVSLKTGGEKYNPYLAHMAADGASNGDGDVPANSPFAGFKRRATTSQQAEKVEDMDVNPFTNKPHTTQYFNILQTRRDLPVHKQRYVLSLRQFLWAILPHHDTQFCC